MARIIQILLFIELILMVPNIHGARHGFQPELLYAEKELSAMKVIEPEALEAFVRNRRDVKSSVESTKTTSSTSSTKIPLSSSPINVRENVTMQTTNNITTMVSISFFSLLFPIVFQFKNSIKLLNK